MWSQILTLVHSLYLVSSISTRGSSCKFMRRSIIHINCWKLTLGVPLKFIQIMTADYVMFYFVHLWPLIATMYNKIPLNYRYIIILWLYLNSTQVFVFWLKSESTCNIQARSTIAHMVLFSSHSTCTFEKDISIFSFRH